MKNAFARRMVGLRRNKGITQKQAAAHLGISQALLSHYEKGVRECGLDFLIKAAEFYDVSADYLLGREKLKTEALTPALQEQNRFRAAATVLFNTLETTDRQDLIEPSADFLALAYLRIFRQLYAGGDGAEISDFTRRALADAAMQVAEAKLHARRLGEQPLVTPEDLSRIYGSDYALLTEVLKKAENQCKER